MRLVPLLLIVFIFSGFLFSCESSKPVESNISDLQNISADPILYALNKAISNDPDNLSYISKRGEYFLEKGYPKYALKDALSLTVLERNNFNSWYLLAKAHYELGHYQESVQAGIQAESIQPNHAELIMLISKSYLLDGERFSAEKYLEKGLAMAPGLSDINLIKGMVSYSKGDTTNALKNLKSGYEKDATNLDIIKELVKVFSATGKKDSAMVFILAGQNVNPHDPFLHYSKANILENQGFTESAFFAYQSALETNPDHILTNKKVAEIYFSNLKYEKAKGYLEKVMEQDSSIISVNHMLAKIYETDKSKREAVILYKNILSRSGSDTTAQNALSRIYTTNPELAQIVKKDTVEVPKVAETVNVDSLPKKEVKVVSPAKEVKKEVPVKEIKKDTSAKEVPAKEVKKVDKAVRKEVPKKVIVPVDTPQVKEIPAVVEEIKAPEPSSVPSGETSAPAKEENKRKGLFKKK